MFFMRPKKWSQMAPGAPGCVPAKANVEVGLDSRKPRARRGGRGTQTVTDANPCYTRSRNVCIIHANPSPITHPHPHAHSMPPLWRPSHITNPNIPNTLRPFGAPPPLNGAPPPLVNPRSPLHTR